MAIIDEKALPPPYTGPPPKTSEADPSSSSPPFESETKKVSRMTEDECRAALRKLDSRIRKYNWTSRTPELERSIVASMRDIAERHPEDAVREDWAHRADAFEKAPEVQKGAILKDIGLGVGMILAAPFAITGAVIMGMGLLLRESGSLLSGGRFGGKKSSGSGS